MKQVLLLLKLREKYDLQYYLFPEEDLCLFKDFPHERYVFPQLQFNWVNVLFIVKQLSIY